MKRINRYVICFLIGMLLKISVVSAFVTPFGLRVNDSIDRGLQYLREVQEPNGGWGRPTGLALLCFLAKIFERNLQIFENFLMIRLIFRVIIRKSFEYEND